MEQQYNLRSPAVKRLMREARELKEPTEQYYCQPLEDNLFEWHFTIRGPADSEFESGIYHGRIVLPPEYPMKPPSIILLTPNGRFEIHKKICLSISGHHPESWQPSWSLRTALLAIIGFMPTHGNGAIGSLDYTPEERKALAKKSQDWKCPSCGCLKNVLLPVTEASKATNREAKELAQQINFQAEKEKKNGNTSTGSNQPGSSTDPGSSQAGSEAPSPLTTPMTGPNPFQAFARQGAQPPFFPFMPGMYPPGMVPPRPGGSQPRMPPPMMPPHMMAMLMASQQARGQTGQNKMGPFPFPAWPPGGSTWPATPTAATSAGPSTSQVPATPSAPATSTPATTTASAAMAAPPASVVTTTTSPANTATSTATQATSLRHRNVATSTQPTQSPASPRVTHASQPAELPRRRRLQDASDSILSTVVMVILGVLLLILMVRRLYMMGILKFEQGADDF